MKTELREHSFAILYWCRGTLQRSKNNSCTEKRLKAYKAKMIAKFKSGKAFDKYRAFLIYICKHRLLFHFFSYHGELINDWLPEDEWVLSTSGLFKPLKQSTEADSF